MLSSLSIFPSTWKIVLVQPVPKKSNYSNHSNYHKITLTSTVGKVFETLINSHFVRHLKTNGPLLSSMDRLSSSLKRSPRLLIESDIRVYWPSFLLMDLLLSAISLQAIYLTALYLVVDGATSASFQSSVVFSGLCTFTNTLLSTHQLSSQLYLFPYSCFYR